MNTLKKYLFWSLIPIILLFFALTGLFRPDPENWHFLSVFFALGLCLALGAMGALYFFTTKRQEVYGSKTARTVVSICFSLSLLLSLADFLGLPQTIHTWMAGSEQDLAGIGYFMLLTRKVFGFVQLIVVILLIRTFFPKKEKVFQNSEA